MTIVKSSYPKLDLWQFLYEEWEQREKRHFPLFRVPDLKSISLGAMDSVSMSRRTRRAETQRMKCTGLQKDFREESINIKRRPNFQYFLKLTNLLTPGFLKAPLHNMKIVLAAQQHH